jgi:crotonobetainyl-CoA:carnitine CoA-transferase CaiB-like acyl-CoA transferase
MSKTAEQIGAEYQTEMALIAGFQKQLNRRIAEATDRMYNQLAKQGLATAYANSLGDLLDTPQAMCEEAFKQLDEAIEEMRVQVGATLGVPDEA